MSRKRRKRNPAEGNPVEPSPSSGLRPKPLTRRRLVIAAAMLVLLVPAIFFFLRKTSAPPEDIILITIDTLRADTVGYAPNARVETPFLSRIAREGRVFTNAHAHNVVTLPSHVNILTGLYPYQHGVRENAGFTLHSRHQTLAAFLKNAGYATAAFVSAYPLDARFGLNAGFDVYDDRYREALAPLDFAVQERSGEETLTAAAAWFARVSSQRRFLWVHLYEPHAPYTPPSPFRERYAREPYLGEVAATDSMLGRFITPMLQSGRRVMLVITSDHGEALGDHGEQTHGLFAYEATLKVPLLVWESSRKDHLVDDRPVRHIDIVPTVLARAGLPPVSALGGRSLFDQGEIGDTYFEALSASLNRGWAPLVGIIRARKKYIDLPIPELYDLVADPSETTNQAERDRKSLFALRGRLRDAAPPRASNERRISEEEQAGLLSLGYITGTTSKKTFTVADDPKNLVGLDTQLHQMVALYQTGHIAQALALAKKLVASRGDMQIAREILAFLLQESEQPQDAVRTLEAEVRQGRASDSMKIRLGLILAENGRAAEAVQLLRPFASQNDPSILNAYAIALADSGDLPGASNVFQRVLEIDQTNARAYQGMGVVALRQGRTAEANAHLLKALSLNDRMPLSLNTLGVIRAREGRADEAMVLWDKAISIDPRQYDAMFNLGILAARNRRNDIAERTLRQFIETAPPERYGSDIEKARGILGRITGQGVSSGRRSPASR